MPDPDRNRQPNKPGGELNEDPDKPAGDLRAVKNQGEVSPDDYPEGEEGKPETDSRR